MVLQNSSHTHTPAESAILTTILYSDIFSTPLTEGEIWKYLISKMVIPRDQFAHALGKLSQQSLHYKDGYYCLLENEAIIENRKRNAKYVQEKNIFARKIGERLSCIPTIKFIGISGSLAGNNAQKEDDIDLFIITQKGTLFFTRLLVTLILEAMQVRRRRDLEIAPNKICVNLLIDETALSWEKHARSVYVAREIAQTVPLYERDNCYKQFIKSNEWITHYMPNVLDNMDYQSYPSEKSGMGSKLLRLIQITGLEFLCRTVQLYYINLHKTKEVITNTHLAFHPVDYGTKTIHLLRLKMRQFGLLTIE